VCSFNEWWEGSVIEPTVEFADSEVFLRTMHEELVSAGWIEAAPVCDPATQPPPHFGTRDGRCLPACGAIGGTHCAAGACPSGTVDVGASYDCARCCAGGSLSPVCDPVAEPAPHFMPVGDRCLPSCGVLGGTRCEASACPAGTSVLGASYDCGACCG
jgi:hypothetical protein